MAKSLNDLRTDFINQLTNARSEIEKASKILEQQQVRAEQLKGAIFAIESALVEDKNKAEEAIKAAAAKAAAEAAALAAKAKAAAQKVEVAVKDEVQSLIDKTKAEVAKLEGSAPSAPAPSAPDAAPAADASAPAAPSDSQPSAPAPAADPSAPAAPAASPDSSNQGA